MNSACDLSERRDGLDLSALEPLQRVLLTTDGTLTDILEAVFLERINLVKVRQRTVPASQSHAWIEPADGETILERNVILRGARTGRNYVYAESAVAIDRLSAAFRRDLLESDSPLGRLWIEHRLETCKELLDVRCERESGTAAELWPFETAVLRRTYRVFTARRPLIVITERFPLTFGHLTDRPDFG
jgi:chorismate-pyruvate lyase